VLINYVDQSQHLRYNLLVLLLLGRRDHITQVLRQLHWLPVRQQVDFKLALLVYKALHDATAAYLVDDCQLVSAGYDRPTSTRVVSHGQHTVRRPELCSRWTAALEQSASQDSPARL